MSQKYKRGSVVYESVMADDDSDEESTPLPTLVPGRSFVVKSPAMQRSSSSSPATGRKVVALGSSPVFTIPGASQRTNSSPLMFAKREGAGETSTPAEGAAPQGGTASETRSASASSRGTPVSLGGSPLFTVGRGSAVEDELGDGGGNGASGPSANGDGPDAIEEIVLSDVMEETVLEDRADQSPSREKTAQEKAQRDAEEKEADAKQKEADAKQKAAQEKAAQEKAAQEKAAQEKAAQEKAAQEKAAQEKALRDAEEKEAEAKHKAAQENTQKEKAAKERESKKQVETDKGVGRAGSSGSGIPVVVGKSNAVRNDVGHARRDTEDGGVAPALAAQGDKAERPKVESLSPPSAGESVAPSAGESVARSESADTALVGRTVFSLKSQKKSQRSSISITMGDDGQLLIEKQGDTAPALQRTGSGWVVSTSTEKERKSNLLVTKSLLSRSPLLLADQKAAGKVATEVIEENPKRKEVITEIMTTERQYVRDLNTIISVFLNPLRSRNILDKQEIAAIFSNVEALVPVNTEILNDLEDQEQSIGEIFYERGDMLKLYAVYCSNQPNIRRLVQKHKDEKEQFKTFLQKSLRRREVRKLDMDSFLIMPLQRLCKYPLLLQELLKWTPEDHSDHEPLKRALEKIRRIVDIVNERVRKVENVIKVQEVEAKLTNAAELDLATYNREFVKEGELRVNDKEMYCFLFSDVLLLCRVPKKGPEGMYYGKRLIPLNMAVATSLDTEDTFELAEIGHKIFICQCKSRIQRNSWVKNLTTVIEKLGGSEVDKEHSVKILRRMTVDKGESPGAVTRSDSRSRSRLSPSPNVAAKAARESKKVSTPKKRRESQKPSSADMLRAERDRLLEEKARDREEIQNLMRLLEEANTRSVGLEKALDLSKKEYVQLQEYNRNMSEMFRKMSMNESEVQAKEASEKTEEAVDAEVDGADGADASAGTAAAPAPSGGSTDWEKRISTLNQMVEKLTTENIDLRLKLRSARKDLMQATNAHADEDDDDL